MPISGDNFLKDCMTGPGDNNKGGALCLGWASFSPDELLLVLLPGSGFWLSVCTCCSCIYFDHACVQDRTFKLQFHYNGSQDFVTADVYLGVAFEAR